MTTKQHAASHTKSASKSHTATEDTMIKHTTTTTQAHSNVHVAKTEEASLPVLAAGATGGAPATTATSTAPSPLSATTGIGLVFLTPPPASANIPVPPPGAAAPGGANYRAFLPKATEHAALPGALTDLKRFTNFNQVLALTGLPYAQVLQAFDVGSQWQVMRTSTSTWDAYCLIQAGIAWMTLRAMIDRLRPVFAIACAADPSLATTYPNLAALLGARRAISAKAVATRLANKAAVARGDAPTHGVVGKKRQRQADKAIVAASKSAATTPSAPPSTSSSAPPPLAVAPSTVAAPSAASTGTTNGATH